MDNSCGIDGSCSSHGSCVSNRCSCTEGWSGFNCEIQSQSPCPYACSSKGSCSSAGVCFCNTGYYGSGCEYSFCGEQSITTSSGVVDDRSSGSPFPLMTTRMCSWSITVPRGKQASVALQLLRDTRAEESLGLAVFVLDGAFTQQQIGQLLMGLENNEKMAKLILASTFPLTLMNLVSAMVGLPSAMPINCSNALWATCIQPPAPLHTYPPSTQVTLVSNCSRSRLRALGRLIECNHRCPHSILQNSVWCFQFSVFIQFSRM